MEGQNDAPVYKTLIIDNIKYKTTLTTKYQQRKVYQPVDLGKIQSFIPGTIRKIFVKEGARVKQGTKLLELEAMKMLNNIIAPHDGVVEKINVKSGDMVSKNIVLLEIKK
ncbi:MAG: acetyl-CoA carboxylase biotin carboxyl carrier protein subunit [Lentimicrobiaceae bacterium]|jgi:biotin carboxyl carrier protein|nr:acetyl-CoA carboxylase biotin carboxyl carrier protein subunit [Lentimicrobiaceae bacterium]MDD4597992.1 acetyl-CoA carboxylase biotin carboxyl carrier protein subunit [Lentimicrobiaceae bacterium]MDY0025983.1 acetyl-CoA carboxylase biotin carboxyl carrier protein subunit [Lentimicrobium sp.]HAH60219.1 acetyl-CoA carboxylase biotin carboxyl carrier protein subunit [Bacteroidales bacterium]